MPMRALVATLLTVLLCGLSGLAAAQPYQWRDAQGRLHFGDRPPEESNATALEFKQREARERFRLNILTTEFELSPANQRRIEAGIAEIFHIYADSFGLDMRGTAEVNLHLLKDQRSFATWYKQRFPEDRVPPASGVFLPRTREVGVWNYDDDEDKVVATILHESSHVMMHQLAPRSPAWLNEGFGEFFENLIVSTDGSLEISPVENSLQRIRYWRESGQLITLRDYLSIPETKWRSMVHDQRSSVPYTLAWGTVYFLMSSPTGQQTIRRMLHDLEKANAWPGIHTLEDRYPGGIPQLEYNFFKWAQQPVNNLHMDGRSNR